MPARAYNNSSPDNSARQRLFRERVGKKGRCWAEVWPWWNERNTPAAPIISDADLELARDHHQKSRCGDEEGKPWPLWSTTNATLSTYGLDIELHFRFLSLAICSLLVATLLTGPLLVLSIGGQGLESISSPTSVIALLARTTIANLSIPSDGLEVFGQRLGKRSVTVLLAVLDVLSIAVLTGSALWFKLVCIPRALEKQRHADSGPEAYTLEVGGLPARLQGSRHTHYARLLEWYLESLLDARVTENTVVPRLLVVHAEDKGAVTWCHRRRRCCGSRCRGWRSIRSVSKEAISRGKDERGRRLGRIVAFDGTTCEVEWLPVPGEEHGTVARHSISSEAENIMKQTPEALCAARSQGEGKVLRFAENSEEEHCKQEHSKQGTGVSSALSELLDAELLERLELAGCDPAQRQIGELPVRSVQLVHDLWGFLRKKRKLRRRRVEESPAASGSPSSRQLLKSPSARIPFISSLAAQNVLGAFVTFRRIRDRDFVRQEFDRTRQGVGRCFSQYWQLQFEGSKIWFDNAPAPADVIWENCDYERNRCSVWSCILFLMCVVMTLCSCTLTAAAQNAISSAKASKLAVVAAIFVSAISLLLVTPVSFLVDLSRPKSRRVRDDRVSMVVFWLQLLHMCLVTPLVYFDFSASEDIILGLIGEGSFSDLVPEWYDKVGGAVLLIMVFHILHPVFGLVRVMFAEFWSHLHASSAQSAQELIEIYTPPHFDLAARQAQLASTLFTALLYSAAMPLLMPLLLVGMSLAYLCDKYVLLRLSREPHARSQLPFSIRQMVWSVLCGLGMHSAMAAWAYSQPACAVSGCHPHRGLHRILIDSALPHVIATISLIVVVVCIFFNLLPEAKRGVGMSADPLGDSACGGEALPPSTGPADLAERVLQLASASNTPWSYSMYELPELSDQVQSSFTGKQLSVHMGKEQQTQVHPKSDNKTNFTDKTGTEEAMDGGEMIEESVPLERGAFDSHEPSLPDDEDPDDTDAIVPEEEEPDEKFQWNKDDIMELEQLERERGIEDTSDTEVCRRPAAPLALCYRDISLLCCTAGAAGSRASTTRSTRPVSSEMMSVTPMERSRPTEHALQRGWLCSGCTTVAQEEVLYMGGPSISRGLDIHVPAAVRVAGRASPGETSIVQSVHMII